MGHKLCIPLTLTDESNLLIRRNQRYWPTVSVFCIYCWHQLEYHDRNTNAYLLFLGMYNFESSHWNKYKLLFFGKNPFENY